MKQLKYLNKTILITMLVCLITACSSEKMWKVIKIVKKNQLVIVMGLIGGDEMHYAFDIDDISDFVKTEQ